MNQALDGVRVVPIAAPVGDPERCFGFAPGDSTAPRIARSAQLGRYCGDCDSHKPRWHLTAGEVELVRHEYIKFISGLEAAREARRVAARDQRRREREAKIRISERMKQLIEDAAQERWREHGRDIEEHRAWARAAYLGTDPRGAPPVDPDSVTLSSEWRRAMVDELGTARHVVTAAASQDPGALWCGRGKDGPRSKGSAKR